MTVRFGYLAALFADSSLTTALAWKADILEADLVGPRPNVPRLNSRPTNQFFCGVRRLVRTVAIRRYLPPREHEYWRVEYVLPTLV